MTRCYLLIVLFLSLLTRLVAQLDSVPTLVLQLSAQRAAALYQGDTIGHAELLQLPVVDSFYRAQHRSTLGVGHYLHVQPSGENLLIELKSQHRHEVYIHNDGKHLRLRVIDSLGRARTDAAIYFEDKEVRYDAPTGYYTRKVGKEGFLRVVLPGDTLFYQVTAEQEKGVLARRLQRFGRTPVVQYALLPYRLGKRTYHYLKRGITRGRWGWQNRFWNKLLFWQRRGPLQGYIALSQPRYRPGDTLRIAAYGSLAKGRLRNDDLRLKVEYRERRRNVVLIDTLLPPEAPGQYTHWLYLSDSLKLDQHYTVWVEHPHKRIDNGLRTTFYLEDYELQDFTYSLTATQKDYGADDPVRLVARAEDSNGQPVFGSELRLWVLAQSFSDPQNDSLLIPDTLWTHRLDLEDRLTTAIVLPDSIFPDAHFDIRVHSLLETPSGETKQAQTDFTVQRARQHLRLRVIQDTIIAEQWVNGRSVPATATLTAWQGQIIARRQIQLPWRDTVSAYTTAYALEQEERTVRLHLQDEPHELTTDWLWQNDTLALFMTNPRRLPVDWTVRTRANDVYRAGTTGGDTVYVWPRPGADRYWLDYSFVWGGQVERERKEIIPYKKELRVTVEPPARIVPGATALVAVQVQRYNGSPVADVGLTAGAVTAQYGSSPPVQLSQVQYKRKKAPFVRYTYEHNRQTNHRVAKLPLTAAWYERLGLRGFPYYRLRYATDPVYTETVGYDSTGRGAKVGHFSPYLVTGGRTQPVYLAYLDDQIIYHYKANTGRPYAFVGSPGKHKLTLRGRFAEYSTQVDLTAGAHQLIGLHTDRPYTSWRVKNTRPYLSGAEGRLINESTLQVSGHYREGPVHIWERPDMVFSTRSLRMHSVQTNFGPFRNNARLTVVSPGIDTFRFEFSPGFRYVFERERDKLFAHDLLDLTEKNYLPPDHSNAWATTDALQADEIEVEAKQPRALRFPVIHPKRNDRYHSSIKLDVVAPPVDPLFYVIEMNDSNHYQLHRADNRSISHLPSGRGTITWYFADNTQWQSTIDVEAHHTLFLRLAFDTLAREPVGDIKIPKVYEYLQQAQLLSDDKSVSHAAGVSTFLYGSVRDAEIDEALIGATIVVYKDDEIVLGTAADIDGNYVITDLLPGTYDVEASYTGYVSQRINRVIVLAGRANDLNFILSTSGASLSEVVVTAYSVPLIQQDNTTSGKTITSDQVRNLPTRNVNAIAGVAAGVSSADPDAAITIRGSRSNATEYYIDGMRVQGSLLSEGAEVTGLRLLGSGGIRSQFSDYAYFQPVLRTDREGRAAFRVVFPDDITRWEHFVAAADRRNRRGLGQAVTQSYLPLQAQLSLPRFLVAGDRTEVRGRVSNFTGDSIQVATFFRDAEGRVLREGVQGVRTGLAETYALTAAESDSLRLTYGLTYEEFTDGEARSIPIFPAGRSLTEGAFFAVQEDTVLQTSLPTERGEVTLEIMDHNLDLLQDHIDYLIKYPWGCTEQTASRLQGLLAARRLSQWRGETFAHDALIREGIAVLRKRQEAQGGWGWWPGQQRSDWITLHVLEVLQDAEAAGFAVDALLTPAHRLLLQDIPNMRLPYRMQVLTYFAENGQQLDYAAELPALDTIYWQGYNRLAYQRLRQLSGAPVELDSLWNYRHITLLDGMYWGEDRWRTWSPRRDRLAQTLLAYRILRDAGKGEAQAAIQRYLLTDQLGRPADLRRRSGYNTLEAAQLLHTLVPDADKPAQALTAKPTDTLPRQVVLTFADGRTRTLTDFPAKITLAPADADGLRVTETGFGPVFATLSQTWWVAQPESASNGFVIATELWQNEQRVDQLELGLPAQLRVTVTTEAEGEYVLVQVPLPAGCSPANRGRQRGEAHRAYHRDRVAIFLERLRAGDHTFTIDLEPRFTGDYTLNPAEAELMYVPVVNGAEGVRRVIVE